MIKSLSSSSLHLTVCENNSLTYSPHNENLRLATTMHEHQNVAQNKTARLESDVVFSIFYCGYGET